MARVQSGGLLCGFRRLQGLLLGLFGLQESLGFFDAAVHFRIKLFGANLVQDRGKIGVIDRDDSPAVRALDFLHIVFFLFSKQ